MNVKKIINVKKSGIMPPNLWFIVGANDNPVSFYNKTSPRKKYRLPELDSRAFPQNLINACTVGYRTYAVNFRQVL
jgi:hypothetical protein